MKQYKLFSLLAGVSLMAFTSCDLEEMPTTSIGLDNNEEAVVNGTNIQQFENGLYSAFRATQYGVYSLVPDLICDGFNESIGSGNYYGPVHRTDASFTASDQDVASIWSGYYGYMVDYNNLINDEYIKEQEAAFMAEDADYASVDAYAIRALGVAHFFRAYTYMQLARLFAKDYEPSTAATDLCVPLVLEYNQEEKPARATVEAVYGQIKKDLDAADQYFMKLYEAAAQLSQANQLTQSYYDCYNTILPSGPGSEAVTLDAIYALYARYYLDTHNYAKAAEYAMTLVSGGVTRQGGYALSQGAQGMQLEYTYDQGTEPIFQMSASLAENGSGTNSVYTNADSAPSSWYQYFPERYYLSPYYLPSWELYSLYENSDLRLSQWFNTSHGQYFGGYVIFPSDGIPAFTKYYGAPGAGLNNTSIPNGRQHVKPFMIGEMYLILAEASLQAGDPTTAEEALNELQVKRGATPTAATMENIQDEWFKETVGEGLRYSCMKRWHIGFNGREACVPDLVAGGTNGTEKVMPADDDHWLLPIPAYERQLNDNLVQNPGY